MKYIDISVKNFSGQFTIRAKTYGITKVSILDKCPKWNLTVVRLFGEASALETFLSTQFPALAVQMHMHALRNASEEALHPIHAKNKALRENRATV